MRIIGLIQQASPILIALLPPAVRQDDATNDCHEQHHACGTSLPTRAAYDKTYRAVLRTGLDRCLDEVTQGWECARKRPRQRQDREIRARGEVMPALAHLPHQPMIGDAVRYAVCEACRALTARERDECHGPSAFGGRMSRAAAYVAKLWITPPASVGRSILASEGTPLRPRTRDRFVSYGNFPAA